jgi:hypothetical protein
MVRYGDLHMTTIAIAGFGYNGGQVIFKHQLDDPLYKNYKEAARTCACCCLPPPRVKISLHPGTCIVGGIDPGNAFNQTQKTTYRALVENKTEKVLSLTLDNIPCPQRSKWEYSLTFIPDGTDQPVSVILLVPTQQYYPKDFLLNCGSGSVDFVRFTKFPPGTPPPDTRLPVADTDQNGFPLAYVDYFNFAGFDDKDGNTGLPEHGLYVENVCYGYRYFKIPCFQYPEIRAAGWLRNGVNQPGYPNFFDWVFFCSDDNPSGKLAYFEVEFPAKQPLP